MLSNCTAKQLMLEFCIKKNQILFNKTGLCLFSCDDMVDLIDNFYECDAARFLYKMSYNSVENHDSDLCPFCSKYVCDECSYGFRHGTCGRGNIYNKICNELEVPLVCCADIMALGNRCIDKFNECISGDKKGVVQNVPGWYDDQSHPRRAQEEHPNCTKFTIDGEDIWVNKSIVEVVDGTLMSMAIEIIRMNGWYSVIYDNSPTDQSFIDFILPLYIRLDRSCHDLFDLIKTCHDLSISPYEYLKIKGK